MIMSLFSKYVLFGSGAVAASYLIYRFLQCRNKEETPATERKVAELDCIDEDDVLDDVPEKCGFEERRNKSDTEDAVEKYGVHAEGVLLWIDEYVAEHYSLNPGPSSYTHIKQDIMDSLMKSDMWNERNEENVKSYIQDYLSRERTVPVQETPSPDVSNAPSSDLSRVPDKESSDEDSFDVDQKIDYMCHHYFGITRDEYMALEEEAARKLMQKEEFSMDSITGSSKVSSGLRQKEKDVISNKVSDESARTLDLFDEKDNKIEKKPKKGWKRFKKRISKFFKRDKDSKSK